MRDKMKKKNTVNHIFVVFVCTNSHELYCKLSIEITKFV